MASGEAVALVCCERRSLGLLLLCAAACSCSQEGRASEGSGGFADPGGVSNAGGTANPAGGSGDAGGAQTGGEPSSGGAAAGATGGTSTGGTIGAGGEGGTSAIWSATSTRIEVWCSYLGSCCSRCSVSYALDAARLTPEQLGIISNMTTEAPDPNAVMSCDWPGYIVIVVDASGTRARYWDTWSDPGGCRNKPYAELAGTPAGSLLGTINACAGSLATDPVDAPTVEPAYCRLSAAVQAGASAWARFTVPAGASYTASGWPWGYRVDGPREAVKLVLHDSAGAAAVAEAEPGAPLTVSEAADYLIELRNVGSGSWGIALELTSTTP